VNNHVVFFIVAAASLILLLLVWEYGEKPAFFLGAGVVMALAPAALYFMVAHPKAIPYVLVTAVHLSLFDAKLQVGLLNLRPNMIVALVAAGILGSRRVLGGVRPRSLPFVGLFLATDAVYLLSTINNSGSPFFWRGVADCVLFLVNVLQYSLVIWFLASDRKAFDQVIRFFLYFSSIYSGAIVLAYTLAELNIGPFGSLYERLQGETGDFGRIGDFGTTMGTYVGFSVVALLTLVLLFPGDVPFSKKRIYLMLGANCGGLLLTFARGPWLAVGLTVALLATWVVIRLPLRNAVAALARLGLVLVLLTVVGTGALLSRPGLAGMVVDRFAGISVLEAGTAADRIELWQNMLEDWKQAPWLGHGAHAYAKFREDPSTQISENFLLELLHSAGLVGFGIFCFVIVKIVIRGSRLFSSAESVQRMPWGLPILAGFVSMCLSSLTNPGMTGGFFWVAMALVVCALELGSPSLNYLTSTIG
jgi:O-antigen ligase